MLGEIAEIGIDGIDMHLEQLCHRGGGPTRGMEQKHFSTTTLPGLQGTLQPSVEATKFVSARFSNT